jgi:predicted AAA+ superfamily ATPase
MAGIVNPTAYHPRLVDGRLDELLAQLPALMVIGPRAVGKTTTAARRAATSIRLDAEAQAVAFRADPDAALRSLPEPVLLDEWQAVPGVLGAVRRAVEAEPRPNRFFITGSVRAELDNEVWPATGRIVRLAMYPMTVGERLGRLPAQTFVDRLAGGQALSTPANTPDLRGYVDLALTSGFPTAALRLTGAPRQAWLDSYLEDLLTHDVEGLEGAGRGRDAQRLRRYFEAYALNSAGVPDHRTIYDAAGVNKLTAAAYERLLIDLLVAEQLPAWTSNRLRRLVRQPKRYVVDPALIATALRMDAQGILDDGDMLGRVLDTFVVAQLRPEVTVSDSRPRLHHLRTEGGRHEVDIVAELAGQRVIGIEIKAAAAPVERDARHLAWLREELGDRFVRGVVLHSGPRVFELGDRIVAAPISVLWGGSA